MYALVTGASAGIGMEITKYLAVKGYDLILTARREDRLQKLRSQILNKYPDRDVIVIPADLGLKISTLLSTTREWAFTDAFWRRTWTRN